MGKKKKIFIGHQKVTISDDNIVYIESIGDIDEQLALKIQKFVQEFGKTINTRINLFIDLNKSGKPSAAARKIFQDINDYDITGKIAFWGIHPVARVLAAFIMGITKKKAIRFFNSREKALEWLKN